MNSLIIIYIGVIRQWVTVDLNIRNIYEQIYIRQYQILQISAFCFVPVMVSNRTPIVAGAICCLIELDWRFGWTSRMRL